MAEKSYKQIVKSTSIIGASQSIQILVKIIGTKSISVFIGPTGIGLLGILQSTLDLIGMIVGMGLGSSAVYDISVANKDNNIQKSSRMIRILMRLVFITGLLGSFFTFFLSNQISIWVFGNSDQAANFKILAVVIFINQIYTGSQAVLNGYRRIKELAYISVIGGVIILIFTVPAYYFFKQMAIMPSILFSAIIYLLVSLYYTKKIKVISVPVSLTDVRDYGKGMLKFGFVSMIIGIFILLSTYQLRLLVNSKLGLFYVGIYQAGWGLTASYVQLIFQSMSRDLSPRLNIAIDSKEEANKLVNEQLHITILISIPILASMLLLSSSLIHILYSPEFYEAVSLLQWLLFGTILRIFSRPLALMLYSARLTKLYLISELFPTILLLIISYLLIDDYGLNAIGIAYTLSYILYNIFIYITTNVRLTFTFDSMSIKCMIVSSIGIFFVFFLKYTQQSQISIIINTLLCILLGCWSFYYLDKLLGIRGIIRNMKKKYFR
ncbi:MAG: oligosaccharide flippase family protein [Fimbriimonadaceae bacterium]|nr:oligosaccharide flippase family protein [Chitinophagales bacterium]